MNTIGGFKLEAIIVIACLKTEIFDDIDRLNDQYDQLGQSQHVIEIPTIK